MDNISSKINDIAVAEYMYQLKIAKIIKSNEYSDVELVTKVKQIINTKDEIIKQISN